MNSNAVKLITSLLLITMLSSCGSYPTTLEEQSGFFVDTAKNAYLRNDINSAMINIQEAIKYQTGTIKTKDFFNQYPQAQQDYESYLTKQILEISSDNQAASILAKIKNTKASGVLPLDKMKSLYLIYEKRLVEINNNGVIIKKPSLPNYASSSSQIKLEKNKKDKKQQVVTDLQANPDQNLYKVTTKDNPYDIDSRIIQACIKIAKTTKAWKDPESVRSEGTPEGVVSAEGAATVYLNLNAKNSYGAYSGANRFVCLLLDGKEGYVGEVASNAGIGN